LDHFIALGFFLIEKKAFASSDDGNYLGFDDLDHKLNGVC
jgi:hypothetical protein